MIGRAGLSACVILLSLASTVAAQNSGSSPDTAQPRRLQTALKQGQVGHWRGEAANASGAYRSGPYVLGLDAVSEPGALAPRLEAAFAPEGVDGVTLTGVAAFPEHVAADFVIARLDPKSPTPSIVFSSYSGGAHCCMDVQIATPEKIGWSVLHLGQFDNEPLGEAPRDLDGDGAVELVIPDDSVDYQFDSFAGSYQPIRIFGLREGKLVDRSREPAFRKFLADDMARAEALCAKHRSGACPAFLADAVRIGQSDRAWKVARAAITPDFGFPDRRCGDRVVYDQCPNGQERPVLDYETALRLFLTQQGYIAR